MQIAWALATPWFIVGLVSLFVAYRCGLDGAGRFPAVMGQYGLGNAALFAAVGVGWLTRTGLIFLSVPLFLAFAFGGFRTVRSQCAASRDAEVAERGLLMRNNR